MERMPRSELKTLDDDTLIEWLLALTRFKAEDISLHIDPKGRLVLGERRPDIEDVEEEIERRGLNTPPHAAELEMKSREDGRAARL